jgi:hypothetical protein
LLGLVTRCGRADRAFHARPSLTLVRLMGETTAGLTHRTTCINRNSCSRRGRRRVWVTVGGRRSHQIAHQTGRSGDGILFRERPRRRSSLPRSGPAELAFTEVIAAVTARCLLWSGLSRQARRKQGPPGPIRQSVYESAAALCVCCRTPLPSSEWSLRGAARVTVSPSLGRSMRLEPISEGF